MRVRRRSPRHSPHHSNAGFTLLEVMIAVIVLSFGVLGVVGLQAASLQANKEARHQSAAVRLGREYADMMRGNNTIAALTTASANPYLIDWNASTDTLPTAATTDCSASLTACDNALKVAQFEASDWLSRVNLELPDVRVKVCFDATPYTAAGIAQWACSNTGNVTVLKVGWTRQSTNRAAAAASQAALDVASTPAVVLPVVL